MDVEEVGKRVMLEGYILDPEDAEQMRAARARIGRCQNALTEANMAEEELRRELIGKYSIRADREEYAE